MVWMQGSDNAACCRVTPRCEKKVIYNAIPGVNLTPARWLALSHKTLNFEDTSYQPTSANRTLEYTINQSIKRRSSAVFYLPLSIT